MNCLLVACSLLGLIGLVSSQGAAGTTSCPAGTCTTQCASGGNAVIGTDCTSYCQCTAGCTYNYVQNCPAGLYYDGTTDECTNNQTVCDSRPTPAFDVSDPCANSNAGFGFFKFNCTHFWWCAAKMFGLDPPIYPCAVGTEWDAAINFCNWPDIANCEAPWAPS